MEYLRISMEVHFKSIIYIGYSQNRINVRTVFPDFIGKNYSRYTRNCQHFTTQYIKQFLHKLRDDLNNMNFLNEKFVNEGRSSLFCLESVVANLIPTAAAVGLTGASLHF